MRAPGCAAFADAAAGLLVERAELLGYPGDAVERRLRCWSGGRLRSDLSTRPCLADPEPG
jgi:hypothetical protein